MLRWFAILALVLAASPALAGACEPEKSVWAFDGDDLRTVAYFPNGISMAGVPLVFEGWKGGAIQWRVTGWAGCTNGVMFCSAHVQLTDKSEIEAPITEVVEGEDWRYVVFGHLFQSSFRDQEYSAEQAELVADRFVPKPADWEKSLIVLPSYYRLVGCQKGDELLAGLAAGDGRAQSQSDAAMHLAKGMSYAEARDLLIGGGWKPANSFEIVDHCPGGPEICKAYPEAEECTDTGAGSCSFRLVGENDHWLKVTAIGKRAGEFSLDKWRVEYNPESDRWQAQ